MPQILPLCQWEEKRIAGDCGGAGGGIPTLITRLCPAPVFSPVAADGASVGFASVPVPPAHKASGKWNTLEIDAKGPEVTVTCNGNVKVSMPNSRIVCGPFPLQYSSAATGAPEGAIQWRKVQVKPIQGAGMFRVSGARSEGPPSPFDFGPAICRVTYSSLMPAVLTTLAQFADSTLM